MSDETVKSFDTLFGAGQPDTAADSASKDPWGVFLSRNQNSENTESQDDQLQEDADMTEDFITRDNAASGNEENSVVQMVDLYSVEPDREQARKSFDPEKLQELADSISRYGVLQPIHVQKEKIMQFKGFVLLTTGAGEKKKKKISPCQNEIGNLANRRE